VEVLLHWKIAALLVAAAVAVAEFGIWPPDIEFWPFEKR
jgi:hypothetical protein